MDLNKKVIESTIVAVLLVIATAVTALSSPVSNQKVESEDKTIVTEVQADGVAGIIEELANTQAATEVSMETLSVSVEKADTVTVAEPAEPVLTEEEQAWSNKLMAKVDEFLYVRSQPDETSDIIGKLYKGSVADMVEQLDGWIHITSGSVDGYVKTEYCVTGTDALTLAHEVCTTKATVLTGGLRLRSEAGEEATILTTAAEGDILTVDTQTPAVEGWTAIALDGSTAYVKSEYVNTELSTGIAITIEEEQAELEKKAAEEAAEAAKKATQITTAMVTQNASVAATCDEVTLLGALIQCEAGNESYEGMVAVGSVVMNRVRSGAYPGSIYDVVYQSGQFTPAGNGSVTATVTSGVSGSCLQAAQEALNGADNTGGATFFKRASSGQSGVVIGNHVFY